MKRILITGASDGLGKEIAKLLLEEGVEVIGLSRTQPKENCIHISMDLESEESIKKAAKIIQEKYAAFDALINCAGVMSLQELEVLDRKEVERVFAVNLVGPMQLTGALMHLIKKNEADVMNVSSTVGLKAYEKQAAYGASKWGMRGFTENLQLELRRTKCRVIGFHPGGFKSRIFEKATGRKVNLDEYMDAKDLAVMAVRMLQLPKNMEVSHIVVNRK